MSTNTITVDRPDIIMLEMSKPKFASNVVVHNPDAMNLSRCKLSRHPSDPDKYGASIDPFTASQIGLEILVAYLKDNGIEPVLTEKTTEDGEISFWGRVEVIGKHDVDTLMSLAKEKVNSAPVKEKVNNAPVEAQAPNPTGEVVTLTRFGNDPRSKWEGASYGPF